MVQKSCLKTRDAKELLAKAAPNWAVLVSVPVLQIPIIMQSLTVVLVPVAKEKDVSEVVSLPVGLALITVESVMHPE